MLILVRVRIQCYIIYSLGTIGLFLVELCIQWIKKKEKIMIQINHKFANGGIVEI